MIFGVFGRSNGNICEAQINGGAAIGEVIAKSGVVLLTGGCCGVPEVAAIAARKNGGFAIYAVGVERAKRDCLPYCNCTKVH